LFHVSGRVGNHPSFILGALESLWLIFTATKTPTHQIIIRPNQNIHFKDIGTSDQSSVAQSSSKISPSILAIQMKICRFMASTKKIVK